MKGVDMKGFAQTWYEICNADGHPLVFDEENRFLSEDLAAAAAPGVAIKYGGTVVVKEHTTTIKRIFHVKISTVEV